MKRIRGAGSSVNFIRRREDGDWVFGIVSFSLLGLRILLITLPGLCLTAHTCCIPASDTCWLLSSAYEASAQDLTSARRERREAKREEYGGWRR